jgi:hypothetical protein
MNWRALMPVIINVVAHVLDEFGNQVCIYGLMLAPLNSNASRPVVPRIGTDAGESFTLQAED